MVTFPSLGHHGRLGNQLFQLAATYAYSIYTNQNLVVKRCKLTDDICCTIDARDDVPDMINKYHESKFEYIEIPTNLIDVALYGHFQSEKYFDKISDDIRNLLAPKFDTNNKQGVAVHIRRGDYLTKPEYHTALDLQYYEKATKLFPEQQFFVFSDDIDWCKKNWAIANSTFIDNIDPWTDLWHITEYENHIIANSSFSWWGAWLCTNKDKKVVAPKTWFGPAFSYHDTKDLIPEQWITL